MLERLSSRAFEWQESGSKPKAQIVVDLFIKNVLSVLDQNT